MARISPRAPEFPRAPAVCCHPIRQPEYRQVYAHALMVAYMSGKLVAADDPALVRIRDAIRAVRDGDMGALDVIERELARLGDG